MINEPTKRGECRICGCTDDAACPSGCTWVDRRHTLCSACQQAARTIAGDIEANWQRPPTLTRLARFYLLIVAAAKAQPRSARRGHAH